MNRILAWFAKLFSGWTFNLDCKAKPTKKERDKVVELTRQVDMDEY